MKKLITPTRALLVVMALIAGVATVLPTAQTDVKAVASTAATDAMVASRCQISQVIGHRGTIAGVHENTLPAFQRAITDGADVIEFDIHRTKDAQWVISHDKTIRGKTISKTKYSTLKKLQPSLLTYRQAMVYLRTKNVRVSVEIKPTSVKKSSLQYFARVINQYRMAGRTEITSFSSSVLKKFHRYTNGVRTSYNVNSTKNLRQGAGSIRKFASSITMRKDLVKTNAQVVAYNRAGLRVYVYTANSVADWRRLNIIGANGVITDYAGSYNRWCASTQPKPPVKPPVTTPVTPPPATTPVTPPPAPAPTTPPTPPPTCTEC